MYIYTHTSMFSFPLSAMSCWLAGGEEGRRKGRKEGQLMGLCPYTDFGSTLSGPHQLRNRRAVEGWEGIVPRPHSLRCSSRNAHNVDTATLGTGLAATLPLNRSAAISRQCAVSRASSSFEGRRPMLQREEKQTKEEHLVDAVRPSSRAVKFVTPRQQVQNYDERHAQLLHEEREQHRLELDRLHQRIQLLKLRGEQERDARMATARQLFNANLVVCETREEAARHAILTAEMEDKLRLSRLFISDRHENISNNTANISVQTVPNTIHSVPPATLYAHDSDLLQALYRAEARIVHLERHHHHHTHNCSHTNCASPHDENGAEWSHWRNPGEHNRSTAAAAAAAAGLVPPTVAATAASSVVVSEYKPLGPRICTSSLLP